MNVVVRADSSIAIGTGHIVRCLSLARGLRAAGASVHFVSRALPGNLIESIRAEGFGVSALDCAGGDWRADAAATASKLGERQVDLLVVDHYEFDEQWEELMRGHAKRLLVIDDLANRRHRCDLLVDHNIGSPERYRALVPEGTTLLVGPQYALLRDEFRQRRVESGPRPRRQIRRLLVFFGGTDPTGESGKALDALALFSLSLDRVDLVVGPQNPKREILRSRCAGLGKVQFHSPATDMAYLISEADFAIGAAGTTSWERCCLGLPSLLISVAENQELVATELARNGCAIYLGASSSVAAQSIAGAISLLVRTPDTVEMMSRNAAALVDGRGVERVLRSALQRVIQLRSVEPQDCKSLLCWRNDPVNRKHSYNAQEIVREEHERWFATALGNPNRVLLLGSIDRSAIGVLRYDCEGATATVSIYLVPGNHGKGYGAALLRAGTQWVKQNRPEVRQILAEIQVKNTASCLAFRNAGYTPYVHTFRQTISAPESCGPHEASTSCK